MRETDPMTDRVGRHAAALDAAETLILPSQREPDKNGNGHGHGHGHGESGHGESGPDDLVRRATGRHAADRRGEQAGPELRGDIAHDPSIRAAPEDYRPGGTGFD